MFNDSDQGAKYLVNEDTDPSESLQVLMPRNQPQRSSANPSSETKYFVNEDCRPPMDSESQVLAGDQLPHSRAPSKGKRKAAARVNEDIDPPMDSESRALASDKLQRSRAPSTPLAAL